MYIKRSSFCALHDNLDDAFLKNQKRIVPELDDTFQIPEIPQHPRLHQLLLIWPYLATYLIPNMRLIRLEKT